MSEGWRGRLRPASFRGVDFFVDALTGTAGGRRVSVLRLAGGELTVQQDHGAEPGEFDVTAFLWGEDYDLQRDRLERALAATGPGFLVLPTRGELRARVTRPPQTQESKNEGGYCSIRFSVVIESNVNAPIATRDTAQGVAEASRAVRAAAATDAEARITTAGFSARQLGKVGELVRTASGTLRRLNRVLSGSLAPITGLTRELDAFTAQAVTLLSTPQLFATTGIDLVLSAFAIPEAVLAGALQTAGVPGTIATAFGRGRAARLIDRAARGMRGLGEPFTARSSASARAAEENLRATSRMLRAAALSAQADAYAELPFDSATFAVAAFGRTLEEIDAVQALEPTDPLFAALDDLRAALGLHIYQTASKLPETIIVELGRPMPALVLAHKLYGDCRLEADIVARNRIANPAWVSGRIEVLRP
jgi:prophage DNA circulation protein